MNTCTFWRVTLTTLLISATLVTYPLINRCPSEDSRACTWHATENGNGNGRTFTDYYGLTIYRP